MNIFSSRRECLCYKGWYEEKQGVRQKNLSDVKAQKNCYELTKGNSHPVIVLINKTFRKCIK